MRRLPARWGALLVLEGAVLLAGSAWFWLAVPQPERGPAVATLQTVMLAGPPVLLLAVGTWLDRLGIDDDLHPVVAGASVAGAVALLAVTELVIATQIQLGSTDQPLVELLSAAGGAMVGLAVGGQEARAITQARAAERARITAERAAERREEHEFLNRVLRHEVLNAHNVIRGHARALESAAEGPAVGEHVDPIVEQSDRVVAVAQRMRSLLGLGVEADTTAPRPVDGLLHEALSPLFDDRPEVEVTVRSTPDVAVRGSDRLATAIELLAENAADRMDGSGGTLRVEATREASTVTVELTDDAPEPARDFGDVAPGPGPAGFPVYFSRQLLERNGGALSVRQNDGEGSTFEVTLPRAD